MLIKVSPTAQYLAFSTCHSTPKVSLTLTRLPWAGQTVHLNRNVWKVGPREQFAGSAILIATATQTVHVYWKVANAGWREMPAGIVAIHRKVSPCYTLLHVTYILMSTKRTYSITNCSYISSSSTTS